MDNSLKQEKKSILKIFTIIEKPNSQKNYWQEIGMATRNRDGSLNGRLNALPVNGTIHIREQLPRNNDSKRRNGDNQSPDGWQ